MQLVDRSWDICVAIIAMTIGYNKVPTILLVNLVKAFQHALGIILEPLFSLSYLLVFDAEVELESTACHLHV